MKRIVTYFLMLLWTVLTLDGAVIRVPADYPTIAAAVAATTTGDSVSIDSGSFAAANIPINASITIRGAGSSNTVISLAGNTGFRIEANNVAIQDLTLQNGATAIEIPHNATIANLTVSRCELKNNLNGLRMANTAVVNGLSLNDSTFANHSSAGIYQENGESTGRLRNLHVNNCVFSANLRGIYSEEIRLSTIQNSTFAENRYDIYIYKGYETAAVTMDDITVRDSVFRDTENVSVLVEYASFSALGSHGISILDNTFIRDVGRMRTSAGSIEIVLTTGFDHGPVVIEGNAFELSGTFSGATAAATAFGIVLLGGLENVSVTRNDFGGGGVASIANAQPPTSGIYFNTQDEFDSISDTARVTVTDNHIWGFEVGISVYNSLQQLYGFLLPGARIQIHNNGFDNRQGIYSGVGEIVDATDNWWGTNDETTVAAMMVGNVDFTPVLDILLVPGWNLVSLPSSVLVEGVATVLATFGVASFWSWDGGQQQFVPISEATPASLSATHLLPSKAYWVYR